MGLPVRPQVAEEAPPLVGVEPLPQGRGVVTDGRDDLTPVDALARSFAHLPAQAAEHPERRARPLVDRRRAIEVRRRLGRDAVCLRKEAAAGDGDHATAVIGVAQGERDVAHREPGSDQEDVLAPVHLEGVARPRVTCVADAREERLVADGRIGRRVVPDREQRAVGGQQPPVVQRQHDRIRDGRRSRRPRPRRGSAAGRTRAAPARACRRGTRRRAAAARTTRRSAPARGGARSGESGRGRPRRRSSVPPGRSACGSPRASGRRRRRRCGRRARRGRARSTVAGPVRSRWIATAVPLKPAPMITIVRFAPTSQEASRAPRARTSPMRLPGLRELTSASAPRRGGGAPRG